MEERKQELIELLNKLFEILPMTYEELNRIFPYTNSKRRGKLRKLEKENVKLGLAAYDTPSEGVSTLSLIATITDVLCDARLGFIVAKNGDIIGVRWVDCKKD